MYKEITNNKYYYYHVKLKNNPLQKGDGKSLEKIAVVNWHNRCIHHMYSSF